MARSGTLETCRDVEGKVYYRGKVRLRDGSLARIVIPKPKCYSEEASRKLLASVQDIEDREHPIWTSRQDNPAVQRRRRSGDEDDASYIRYLEQRLDLLEKQLSTGQRRVL